MATEQSVRLRPATPEDRFLIRRWLAEPEVQSWWGTAASAEAEITLALASAAALPRIIERDGVAIGYAHAVEIGVVGEQPPDGVPAGRLGRRLFRGAGRGRRCRSSAAPCWRC